MPNTVWTLKLRLSSWTRGVTAMSYSSNVNTGGYEPKRKRRKRENKAPEIEKGYRGNRRRMKGSSLNRKRREYCERAFGELCETVGRWRRWLCGLENARKDDASRSVKTSNPRNWKAGRKAALAIL